MEGGLVDDVGEVGAGEAGREGGEALGEDVGLVVEHDALHVLLEDLLALEEIRQVDLDVTVEPAGAEEGLVQHVRSKNEESSNIPFNSISVNGSWFSEILQHLNQNSESVSDLKGSQTRGNQSQAQFTQQTKHVPKMNMYTHHTCLWRPA